MEAHEMATKQPSLVDVDEEDWITIELSPSSNSSSQSIGSPSPPKSKEIELQKEKKSKTSKADKLFNKGKLPPIDESPDLEMVEEQLDNPKSTFDHVRSLSTLEKSSISTNAINLSGSRRFSSYEPNQSEFLFEWFTGRFGFVVDAPKKTWAQKLKETKQFWLNQKFKASRDYIKSLFSKTRCSDANEVGEVINSKCRHCHINNVNSARTMKNPFEMKKSCPVMHNINRNIHEDGFKNKNRRSFSRLFRRGCSSKASSLAAPSSGSSSKSSSGKFHDLHCPHAEMERSIEAAIEHCKQSLKQGSSDKASDDDKVSSQLASKTTVCGNQEKAAPGTGRAEPKGE